MEDLAIQQRVKATMSKVFGVEVSEINDLSSQDTIEKWDSLGHFNLVVALEEEFQIQLNDSQIVELLNYKLIVTTVKEILHL